MNEFALHNKKNKDKKGLLLKGFVVGVVSQVMLFFTSLSLIDVLIIGVFLVLLLGFANELRLNRHSGKQLFDIANLLAVSVGGVLASVFTAAIISVGNLMNNFPEFMF